MTVSEQNKHITRGKMKLLKLKTIVIEKHTETYAESASRDE